MSELEKIIGFEDNRNLIQAAGALLGYVAKTQPVAQLASVPGLQLTVLEVRQFQLDE